MNKSVLSVPSGLVLTKPHPMNIDRQAENCTVPVVGLKHVGTCSIFIRDQLSPMSYFLCIN